LINVQVPGIHNGGMPFRNPAATIARSACDTAKPSNYRPVERTRSRRDRYEPNRPRAAPAIPVTNDYEKNPPARQRAFVPLGQRDGLDVPLRAVLRADLESSTVAADHDYLRTLRRPRLKPEPRRAGFPSLAQDVGSIVSGAKTATGSQSDRRSRAAIRIGPASASLPAAPLHRAPGASRGCMFGSHGPARLVWS